MEFSARTVISPDPNLEINEVAIPSFMSMILTYPERVTKRNRKRLMKNIINGPKRYPGANYVQFGNDKNQKYFLKNDFAKSKILEKLRIGDVVHRHVRKGDVVLFNRQPSLHR